MTDPGSELAPKPGGDEHWKAASADEVVQYIDTPEHPDADPRVHLATGELVHYEPLNPVEISFAIQEIQAALSRYAKVYPILVAERYRTETLWIEAENQARIDAPAGGYDRDRAAYAKIKSLPELRAFQLAKTKQYAADALERALRSKLFGYLNLNNNMSTLYNSAGHGN